MNKLNKEDLQNILNKHKLWLLNEEGGERADLSSANLSNVDLNDVNLSSADLTYANLRCADLSNTNLEDADLRGADLEGANLRYANLSNADLRYANLRYADLRYANLKHIKTNMHTIGYHLACPEKGSFIGYKKAFGYLITLLILEDAKRSSATTLKCRCDKAKVLEIKNIISGELISKIESEHDENFIYKVGEIVKVEDFDNDRWNECSTGIHFFMNKENAINY